MLAFKVVEVELELVGKVTNEPLFDEVEVVPVVWVVVVGKVTNWVDVVVVLVGVGATATGSMKNY